MVDTILAEDKRPSMEFLKKHKLVAKNKIVVEEALPLCTNLRHDQTKQYIPNDDTQMIDFRRKKVAVMDYTKFVTLVRSIMTVDDVNIQNSTNNVDSNPVKELNIMNINEDMFKDCRITPTNEISVVDAIATFRGVDKEKSKKSLHELTVVGKIGPLPKFQFPGERQRPTPVAPFQMLLQILSQLPGEQAKILRKEQAEITSRVIEGEYVHINEIAESSSVNTHTVPMENANNSDNPVLNMAVMQITAEDLVKAGVEIFHDGSLCVLCAVKWFRGLEKECTLKDAKDVLGNLRRVGGDVNLHPLKHKSSKHGHQQVDAMFMKDLLKLLCMVPGQPAKILQNNLAEITSRLMGGDQDLEEAVRDRRETVDSTTANIAMAGLPTTGERNKLKLSPPGLYLIEIGSVKSIKEDVNALPKRRKDILNLSEEKDEWMCYKLGFSKHLDMRSIQHCEKELKDTSFKNVWHWSCTPGMLVQGEDYIREQFRELGCDMLKGTIDWPILPPKYEEVIGDFLQKRVHDHLINNDPCVELIMQKTLHRSELELQKAQHETELVKLEMELLKATSKAERLQLVIEKKDLEMLLMQRDTKIKSLNFELKCQ